MKILVRDYPGDTNPTISVTHPTISVTHPTCNYVWKEVRKNKPFLYENYYTKDGSHYSSINVLKISGDFRKHNYVMCGNCGDVVKRDKLARHYEDQERNINCLKCKCLNLAQVINVTHKLMPNGTVVTKTTADPYCKPNYYNKYPLDRVDKPAVCLYYKCRRSDAVELWKDFHSEYPNPFKRIATENAAIAAGWRYLDTYFYGREYTNKDGKLIAQFDTNGILVNYKVLKRSSAFMFVYSDVYDKFFDNYGEFDWGGLSEVTVKRYSRQIREIYK